MVAFAPLTSPVGTQKSSSETELSPAARFNQGIEAPEAKVSKGPRFDPETIDPEKARSKLAHKNLFGTEADYSDRSQLTNAPGHSIRFDQKAVGTSLAEAALQSSEQNLRTESGFFSRLGTGVVNGFKAVGAVAGAAMDLTASAARGVYNLGSKATEAVADAALKVGDFLLSKETWTSAGSAIASATKAVLDPENWVAVGSKVVRGVSAVVSVVTDPQTYKNIGSAIASGVEATARFLTDPQTWKSLGSAIASGAAAVGNFALDIVRDPAKAWDAVVSGAKAVGGFAKGLSDSLGITDMAVGVASLVKAQVHLVEGVFKTAGNLVSDTFKVVSGQIPPEALRENLAKNIKDSAATVASDYAQGARAIKGAVVCLGEVTGVTDAGKAVYYVAKGDYANAALHASFAAMSAGSIVATVATVGAAAPALVAVTAGRVAIKEGLEQATKAVVKEATEQLAKGIGKEVGEQLTKSVSVETLQKTGEQIAQATVKSLDAPIAKIMADSTLTAEARKIAISQTTQEVAAKQTEKAVEGLLKKAGVEDKVKELVFERLKDMSHGGKSEITERLMAAGMDKEAAEKSASKMVKALKSGKHDDVLKQGFEDQITREIMDEVKKDFKPTMQRSFQREFDELVKKPGGLVEKHGLNEAEQRAMKEGAAQGFEEGFERGVRKVVRRGIERAFDEFRKRDNDSSAAPKTDAAEELKKKYTQEDALAVSGLAVQASRASEQWNRQTWKKREEGPVTKEELEVSVAQNRNSRAQDESVGFNKKNNNWQNN